METTARNVENLKPVQYAICANLLGLHTLYNSGLSSHLHHRSRIHLFHKNRTVSNLMSTPENFIANFAHLSAAAAVLCYNKC